jgi:hypothetical protein
MLNGEIEKINKKDLKRPNSTCVNLRSHEVGNECIEGKSKKNKKTKFSIKKY